VASQASAELLRGVRFSESHVEKDSAAWRDEQQNKAELLRAAQAERLSELLLSLQPPDTAGTFHSQCVEYALCQGNQFVEAVLNDDSGRIARMLMKRVEELRNNRDEQHSIRFIQRPRSRSVDIDSDDDESEQLLRERPVVAALPTVTAEAAETCTNSAINNAATEQDQPYYVLCDDSGQPNARGSRLGSSCGEDGSHGKDAMVSRDKGHSAVSQIHSPAGNCHKKNARMQNAKAKAKPRVTKALALR